MSKILQSIEDKNFLKMKEFLLNSFFEYVCSDKLMNNKELSNIHKTSIALKSFDMVSIAMSYLAINNYRQGARYYQTVNLLNDAKILASSSGDLVAQKIPNYSHQKAIVIGDSLSSDIQGANNAGLDCIWLNLDNAQNNKGLNITFTAKSLAEIKDYLLK